MKADDHSRRHAAVRVLRDGVVAGTVGGVLGGLPSTVHALATGNDPFRATVAAGTLVLPHERRRSRLLPAAALAHGSISVLWGMALALILPRRRSILAGSVAGLGIAALDLGIIGRRFPGIRSLPVGPQIADHVAFGAAVGAVLAIRDADLQAERVIPAPPAQIFEFLSDLRNHWKLEDCFAQLDTLQSGHRSQLRGGTVRLTGPLGISRTARTRVVAADPPEGQSPGRLTGRADIGVRTRGHVAWEIIALSADTSRVVLSGGLDRSAPLDRALFIVGRPWLERTFRRVLANLADAVDGHRAPV